MSVFDTLESDVRSYCRSWPTVFDRAQGSRLYDENERGYLDFFAGAGALNYGHNHPLLKQSLIDYISRDGVVHSLDMSTKAKEHFLQLFDELILKPRSLNYKVQFPGPTGTNSVEAALKLARKVSGRETIISFTNAFHGMTLGSLAVTGDSMKRGGAGIPLGHAMPMPYDRYFDGQSPDFMWLESLLVDGGSGLDRPAAVIVETLQGEGGVNSASAEWLRGLAELCKRHELLLIVDDVQAGCGRTGPFFSFEDAGITPDIVCLSKSISGYGLPMALTLFRPELDIWEPGEHNGTFRGHNPAFVTGAAALNEFWSDDQFEKLTRTKGEQVAETMDDLARRYGAEARGRGLLRGLAFEDPDNAVAISRDSFERGLLVERAGARGEVVKLMPPLTISEDELSAGLDIVADAVAAVHQ